MTPQNQTLSLSCVSSATIVAVDSRWRRITLDTMRLFGCFKCCNRAEYDDDVSYYAMSSGGMIDNSWTRDDYLRLGNYIGDSESIQILFIDYFPYEREDIDALMGGLSRNRSIQLVEISTDLSNHAFTELGRVMRNMENIQTLEFCSPPNRRSTTTSIGPECADSIASVIGQCEHVKNLVFRRCASRLRFSGVFGKIAVALHCSKRQLEQLSFQSSNIGRDGCVPLGKTLKCLASSRLKYLDLSYCAIDDDGLRTLVMGLNYCNPLHLCLSGNFISAAGLGYLSVLFESESCSLEELSLYGMRIGDDGAAALADGLKSNTSLKHLRFATADSSITAVGWSAFSRLLCDTSSINNTYSSNRTLEVIGHSSIVGIPWDVEQYLTIDRSHQHCAAMYKVLLNHSVFHLQSFYQWDLKFLPLVADWFDKALVINDSSWVQHRMLVSFPREELQRRKLSSLYQYFRGIPLLEVSDHYTKDQSNAK
eukprot:scaffold1352_cov120-Skeletonema_dohrnii-CCMP3373.AAC.2